MKINQIAFKIHTGVFIIPDRLLRTMNDDSYLSGTTIYELSQEEIEIRWVRLIQACPDIDAFSDEERKELKCRLFTARHILLVSSSAGFGKLRYDLEHEWFHKLCFSHPEERDILFQAYKEIYAHQKLGLIAMDFFINSPYGRYPSSDEFWAQWFRQSLFEGEELEFWEMFKEKVRSLQNEPIVRAVHCVDNDLSHRVIHEVSKLYPEIQAALERYRVLPKEVNLQEGNNGMPNHKVLLKERFVIHGVNMRFEWDKEENRDRVPTVIFGDKRISWMQFNSLFSTIETHRLCMEQYASQSDHQQKQMAPIMVANLEAIMKAVNIWPEAETFTYAFRIGAYTRYYLNASRDSEEMIYWRCQVIEYLDKLYKLLELEKIVRETIPYHVYFWAPVRVPQSRAALKNTLTPEMTFLRHCQYE